jgi:hypothetical protein
MAALVPSSSTTPISIAIEEWNVSLRAQALLSDAVREDQVQAVFDLVIHSDDMDALFKWRTLVSNESDRWEFAATVKTRLVALLKKQLIEVGDADRAEITPSLATHFRMSTQKLLLSAGMSASYANPDGLVGCNMVEEKILAVSKDLYNSTSAFMLFEPNSRLLLAKDYYNLGLNALDYILDEALTVDVANKIYTHLMAYRTIADGTVGDAVSGVFIAGDELTFNVIANSSASQYDIIPNSNRNLSDRNYKFRIVCDDSVDTYAQVIAEGGIVGTGILSKANVCDEGVTAPIAFNGMNVMGHTVGTYPSIFTQLVGITAATGLTGYIDSVVTSNTYNTGVGVTASTAGVQYQEF